MAVKRKLRKSLAVRGEAVRLKPTDSLETLVGNGQRINLPEDLLDRAAQPDSDASRVMLVITLAALAFIGFIAWCVSLMPAR